MLNIAVCDDMPEIRSTLRQYLAEYSEQARIPLHVVEYQNGTQLLSSSFLAFDLLILDIQMGTPNGIETAKKIRAAGGKMTIIFFTSYVQYAIEGYEVAAFRFLLKPLTYAQFTEVVGKALTQMQEAQTDCLHIHLKDSILRLPVQDIRYAETERGHVVLHTRSGQAVVCPMTMKELEDALENKHFFRCHTAYLINLQEIERLLPQEVVLQGNCVLPVSKHRKKDMKSALARLWGDEFL